MLAAGRVIGKVVLTPPRVTAAGTEEPMPDRTLSRTTFTAVMEVPIEQVDIAAWLFSMPSAEYRRCAPPDHIAAGVTRTDDGRPVSIAVEVIGDALVVQHYVGEETSAAYCRMVSRSDAFTPRGRTTVGTVWELRATRLDDGHSKYENTVTLSATDDFLAFVTSRGTTLAQVARDVHAAATDHCARETPGYAASVARHARLISGEGSSPWSRCHGEEPTRRGDDMLFGQEHVKRYQETDGEVGHEWEGTITLLLTTTGHKTGQRRTTPLIYQKYGEDYLVVASKGGADEPPQWYRNLQADPNVEVQVLGDKFPARARTASPEEKPGMWQVMVKTWPAYEEYQRKTDRNIPVVVLERA
jgi:deazaflavin-dependent oxidoreductase (nitroreductase family)